MTGTTATPSAQSLGLISRTTRGRSGIRLTIGALAHGTTTVQVFDSQGACERSDLVYEIGSITKTFTASLLAKQVSGQRMSLDDPLAHHLDWLDQSTYSPSLARIAAHIAGYSATAPLTSLQYAGAITDLLCGRNQNINPMGVSEDRFRRIARCSPLQDRDYGWKYSNLGYALLGCALGAASGQDYTTLMNTYLRNDLALTDTRVGTSPAQNLHGTTRNGVDCGNWDWATDEYQLMRPAGAISSTAEDLLKYARFCIDEHRGYLSVLLARRARISRRDEMGLGWWLLKDDHHIIHHGGGTGSFGSFLLIDLRAGAAAVVLANQRLSHNAERRIAESLLDDFRS